MKKIVAPFLRTPYNYDMNAAGDESALECLDETRAQQHLLEETDINVMYARYLVTGEMPQLTMPPLQGDFTDAPTMQEALNLVVAARESFMKLDAKVRSKFNNDAAAFVDFCSNEANRDEMRQMGLWSDQAVASWKAAEKAKADTIVENQALADQLRAQAKAKADTQKGVS